MRMRYRVCYEDYEGNAKAGHYFNSLLRAIISAEAFRFSRRAWVMDTYNDKFEMVINNGQKQWPLVWENVLSTPNQRRALRVAMTARKALLKEMGYAAVGTNGYSEQRIRGSYRGVVAV